MTVRGRMIVREISRICRDLINMRLLQQRDSFEFEYKYLRTRQDYDVRAAPAFARQFVFEDDRPASGYWLDFEEFRNALMQQLETVPPSDHLATIWSHSHALKMMVRE